MALTILSLEVLGWGLVSKGPQCSELPEDPWVETSLRFLTLVQNWPRQMLTAVSIHVFLPDGRDPPVEAEPLLPYAHTACAGVAGVRCVVAVARRCVPEAASE